MLDGLSGSTRRSARNVPWLWVHVHRPICAIRWQECCPRQITRTAIARNHTGVHHLIWQCRSGIAWFSDWQCHTRLYIWPEATTERICKGTSISNDWCIPEQSHDSCTEAGRKYTVLDFRCNNLSSPSGNFQYEDKWIMYKALVNHEDRCATIAEKWDISPSTVWKHHESLSTTKEDPTGSQHLVIKERSSVIWAHEQWEGAGKLMQLVETEGKRERLTSHHLVAYKCNVASCIYLYTLTDLQYQQCWTWVQRGHL